MGLRGPLENGVEIIPSRSDRPVPRPPDDLHPQLKTEWETYWTSDVAQAADEVDIPMVMRLFAYRDEWLRMRLAYVALAPEDRVIVTDSRTGNTHRIHPFAERMTKIESEISKLEDKLGLSPLSRARLGIEIGQQKLTWRQLAKETGAGIEATQTHTNEFAGLPVASARRD